MRTLAQILGWPLAAVIILFLRNSLPEGMNLNNNWFMLLIIFLVGGLVGFAAARAARWLVDTGHNRGWVAVRLAAGEAQTGPLDIWYLVALPAILTAAALALLLNQAARSEPQGI